MPIDKTKSDAKMKRLSLTADQVMTDAYKFFVDVTPIDTGHAKASTKLNLKARRIDAKYKYASILDKGRHKTPRGMRGSNQAPDGMTSPTIKKFKQWIKAYAKTVR